MEEIGVTNKKIEGDRKTPLGIFSLGIIMGTHKKIRTIEPLKYIQINEDMYWVDDPKSKFYNKLVNIKEIKQDWDSAEHLIEYPIQYEYLIEIKTNPKNIPNQGSAIFLHCINKYKENKNTSGCIAIESEEMKKLITCINKETRIVIKRAVNNTDKIIL